MGLFPKMPKISKFRMLAGYLERAASAKSVGANFTSALL
jgi:hypothetical protein